MSNVQNFDRPANRLLALLPTEVYERLTPHLELGSLTIHQPIYDVDESIPHVYFPHDSLFSLVTSMEDGSTIEVSLVGREGMVGIVALLGGTTKSHRAYVQVPGQATRMSAATLKAEFDRGGPLQSVLLRYYQALFSQAAQSIACNRFHSTNQRLARWLLLVRDCVQSDTFLLTQEFIGEMLGVPRPSVTVAAGNLSQAGVIRYTRGQVTILDGEALENYSCECYGAIQRELAHLLGPL
ncbi:MULTISPECIES: Crp/Fnr family transcriptional regulator [Cyanophyceae]|uniref:Crp/Fnr family transcriptional regulator n=1 Tax=Cyanophyceae TaxID=3028117 RepID=UPI00168A08E0|nr:MULTISPECIES: Crp/Fnr family transcriptional regulator [Cyanophyceae]MBD1914647.1 Crp/Fnr family transcriptional regulator [Phormidium sp. FACHB-77]MBD2028468.1 Crp/Fnr family transcriptional regulator [Phormidium sp. FACHB-322]MBD2053602.1 Crp/Fnr family transcriptional regulator [Leptolyngbya sp. FACHB-60]